MPRAPGEAACARDKAVDVDPARDSGMKKGGVHVRGTRLIQS